MVGREAVHPPAGEARTVRAPLTGGREREAGALEMDDAPRLSRRAQAPSASGHLHPTDESLYRLAREGDRIAFSELYGRHRDALYRFLWGWTGDRFLAEDCLQDAFVAVMTRGPVGFASFRFRPYLYRAALNRAVDIRRREGREAPTDPGDLATQGGGPVAFSEAVDVTASLEQAMAALSPEQRLVIALHYFADLPVAEVARLLHQPVGTVKTRLSRSYPRLLAALGREGW
jgi:RNA polymerase sigma-70 factor (ECF subfamily)